MSLLHLFADSDSLQEHTNAATFHFNGPNRRRSIKHQQQILTCRMPMKRSWNVRPCQMPAFLSQLPGTRAYSSTIHSIGPSRRRSIKHQQRIPTCRMPIKRSWNIRPCQMPAFLPRLRGIRATLHVLRRRRPRSYSRRLYYVRSCRNRDLPRKQE